MIFRSIKPDEVETWARLCGDGFEEDWQYFYNHYANDPWADNQGVFVADDGGKLVSSVRVFRREVYINGSRVTMGGIGEVTTLREYRGKGLSTKLLNMAASYMETTGLDLSFLFTGTNHHYAHVGWFTLPRRRVKTPILSCATDGYSLRMATREDIPTLSALHDNFAPRFNGVVVRTPEYFERWFNAEDFTIVERDGKAAAFALLHRNDKQGAYHVSEYSGEQAAFEPMLNLCVIGSEIKAAVMPAALTSMIKADIIKNDFREDNSLMVRFNRPFIAGGQLIDSVPKAFAALSDAVFFGMDGF